MDKLIVPNFHVIFIHFPLALLGVGVAIELFSFMWRRSTFRIAGQWMILLGTLAAVPAVTTGLYALADVMSHGNAPDAWVDLKSSSGFNTNDWNFVRYHIIMNVAGTLLALFAVVLWLGASDSWRRILRLPALAILVIALAAMINGAWHGGEMAFKLGFGVQGKLDTLPDSPEKPKTIEDKVEYLAPNGEVHLLMAGAVFAMAAAALGLSIRRAVTTETVIVQRVPPTYISAEAQREGNVKPISLLQALNDPGDEIPVTRTTPAGRFWVIGALLVLGAIGSGFWFGDYLKPWPFIIDREHLIHAIHRIPDSKMAREGLHIVFAASILILMLIMAMLTRFAPRSRVFFSGFAFLLVLVMAAQIWIGVLMTFDGGRGPLGRYKTAAEATEQMDEPAPATQPSLSPTTLPSVSPMTMGQ